MPKDKGMRLGVRGRAVLVAIALGIAVPVAGVAPAGVTATSIKARVLKTVDGDTLKVDYKRSGRFDGRTDAFVRLIGIDTPEHDTCGYGAATKALRSLVRKKVVTLVSDTGSTGIRSRPERRVLVRSGGQVVDATTWMLERGHGVWMPRKGEQTNTRAHHVAADTAARAGIGWFDEDRCGVGPGANGALSMHAQYLPDYAPKLTLGEKRNEEFIRIRNDGLEVLDLDGWILRVGNNRSTRIPASGPLSPGETLTVHIGSGANNLLHRYLGGSGWMLADAKLDGRAHIGSGSYLVDPHGDIRAWQTWPCVVACELPGGGQLALTDVTVDPPGPEHINLNLESIAITNVGTVPVRTSDLVVEVKPWSIEFPPDHVLEPGETVRIYGGAGEATRLSRYVNADSPILRNASGRVVLRTYDAIVVDCYAWGDERCPRGS